MESLNILNAPEDAFDYEFVVCRKIDNNYWYWGHYTDCLKAEQIATEIGGIIIHNMRIQHYKKGGRYL